MKKLFLSKTARHRTLIFGVKHQIVNLYQVCSNYIPGAKTDPPRGHMFYIGLYKEKHEKIFLSETIRLRTLIFGMYYHLVDLYRAFSNYAPGAKMAPRQVSPGTWSTDTYM